MAPIRNTCIIYQSIPNRFIVPGETTRYDDSLTIDLEEVPLAGGFLVKVLILSSDPYLREKMRDVKTKSYAVPFILGELMENFGIAIVLRSKDPHFQAADRLYGIFKFQEYIACHSKMAVLPYMKLGKHPLIPLSLYAGVIGMPGQAAFTGWKVFANAEEKAQKAKTLFVTSGAGAVGSFVIQFAKHTHPHLKVITSAGSTKKVNFLKYIGVDVAFNYKEQSTTDILAPEEPIDIYWDSVAGPSLDAVLPRMAVDGLIVACGAISAYNGEGPPIKNFHEVFTKSIKIEGYALPDLWLKISYSDQFYAEIPKLVADGKIKYREHKYHGLRKGEQALSDVHTGVNEGKAVIIVAEE
ncbi:NAD(P)-binding protein [Ramaria rubella]|nr:NAD(P)-binding protein [Ramaria rubella]